MRAAQASLTPKLVEGDPTNGARSLIQSLKFFRRLPHGHLLDHLLGQGGRHAGGTTRFLPRLGQVLSRMIFAQMKLFRLATGQLSYVKGRRFVTFLAFHQRETKRRKRRARDLGWDRYAYRHQDSNTDPHTVNPIWQPGGVIGRIGRKMCRMGGLPYHC